MPSATKRRFTRVFEKAREAREMTVQEVANKASLDEATIYRALRDNGACLRLETLERLCDAVGVDPAVVWMAR